jgi:hypothetical protein
MDPFLRAVYFNMVFQKEDIKGITSDIDSYIEYIDRDKKSYKLLGNTFMINDGFVNGVWGKVTIGGNTFNINRVLVNDVNAVIINSIDESGVYALSKNMFPSDYFIRSTTSKNNEWETATKYTYVWDTVFPLPIKITITRYDTGSGEVLKEDVLEYTITNDENETCYYCVTDSVKILTIYK